MKSNEVKILLVAFMVVWFLFVVVSFRLTKETGILRYQINNITETNEQLSKQITQLNDSLNELKQRLPESISLSINGCGQTTISCEEGDSIFVTFWHDDDLYYKFQVKCTDEELLSTLPTARLVWANKSAFILAPYLDANFTEFTEKRGWYLLNEDEPLPLKNTTKELDFNEFENLSKEAVVTVCKPTYTTVKWGSIELKSKPKLTCAFNLDGVSFTTNISNDTQTIPQSPNLVGVATGSKKPSKFSRWKFPSDTIKQKIVQRLADYYKEHYLGGNNKIKGVDE